MAFTYFLKYVLNFTEQVAEALWELFWQELGFIDPVSVAPVGLDVTPMI